MEIGSNTFKTGKSENEQLPISNLEGMSVESAESGTPRVSPEVSIEEGQATPATSRQVQSGKIITPLESVISCAEITLGERNIQFNEYPSIFNLLAAIVRTVKNAGSSLAEGKMGLDEEQQYKVQINGELDPNAFALLPCTAAYLGNGYNPFEKYFNGMQELFISKDLYPSFRENSVGVIERETKKQYPDFSQKLTGFVSLALKASIELHVSMSHVSECLNYNAQVEKIFDSLVNCFLPLIKEVKLLITIIRSYPSFPKSLWTLSETLNNFFSNATMLLHNNLNKPLACAFDAYNLFHMLLINRYCFQEFQDKIKDSKYPLEKIVLTKLIALIDTYLDKLYPFAKQVFEYEKSLLSKEVADKLVFPEKNANDKWILPKPGQQPEAPKKPARKGPEAEKPAQTPEDSNVAEGKREINITEFETEQPHGGRPKKKGGKAILQESSKGRILREVEQEKKEEEKRVQEKKANLLSRSNVLTADEWEAVYGKLDEKWIPAFACLFGSFKSSDLKLTIKNIEALAKKLKEAILKTFPGDKEKEKLAEEFLRDVKNHNHPIHGKQKNEGGGKLPYNYLVIMRQYFLQRGIFPRNGDWVPTSDELVDFEIFLTALSTEETTQEE